MIDKKNMFSFILFFFWDKFFSTMPLKTVLSWTKFVKLQQNLSKQTSFSPM